MRFYDVSVNRSVPTEANRGLTSYSFAVSTHRSNYCNSILLSHPEAPESSLYATKLP
jgi:hypothetical protein